MNPEERKKILQKAKEFFRNEIVDSHINKACETAGQLKNYNVNPFLLSYLSNFLTGQKTSKGMAKALIYPRLLGTSVNTIFGSKFQKLTSVIFEGLGSTTSGIDIEFVDFKDGRKKYCQLKSGPNTINHDDVTTIKGHFKSIRNLAKTNAIDINYNDLIVGVLYGEKNELSMHYKRIDKDYPVYIGKEFWYRLTGDEDFYEELITAVGEVAVEVDGTKMLRKTIDNLSKQLEEKYFG